MTTNACQFPTGIGFAIHGVRRKTNEHITLYANNLVYHAFLCTEHRALLTETVPEFGLVPVGGRTKDAKRRTMYVSKSGVPFTAAQARAWLIRRGDLDERRFGRLSRAQIDAYAAKH